MAGALLDQHPELRRLRRARTVAGRAGGRRGGLGRAVRLGPRRARQAAAAGQPFGDPWMLLTAAALATSRLRLGTAGHAGPPPAPRAARPPGGHAGRALRRPGHLRCRARRPDRGRVRQLRRHHRPGRARRAARRGARPAGRYWTGEPVDHDGRALPRPADGAAAGDRPAPAPAGLDRRLLAEPPADAPRGPLGRRGAAVRVRAARPHPAGRGARARRLPRRRSAASARTSRSRSSSAGRAPAPPPTCSVRCATPAPPGGTSAPVQTTRSVPPRSRAAPRRSRSARPRLIRAGGPPAAQGSVSSRVVPERLGESRGRPGPGGTAGPRGRRGRGRLKSPSWA